jgi:hypothetical protein
MPDPREIMARAMCQAQRVEPEQLCAGLGVLIPLGESAPAWRVRLPYIDAAIAAMREAGYVIVPMEPTEAMWKAGCEEYGRGIHTGICDAIRAAIAAGAGDW